MYLFSATQASTGDQVQTAIRNAAATTGTDFQYLLTTAQRESSLNPTAHAPNSSASGLFQFLDSTWLQMVKEKGPSYGLSNYADAITKTDSGRYVADPSMRKTILDLRTDPSTNAMMAGAFTEMNSQYLTSALGRTPTSGELYIAHFMGASGAAKLIGMASEDSGANAAAAFPHQAGANRSIFYARDGSPRSAAQVYANLVSRYDASTQPAKATTEVASAGDDAASAGVIKISQNPQAWLAIPAHNAYAIEPSTPFHSLFRTDSSAPISNYVAATWSNLGTDPAQAATGTPAVQSAATTPAPDLTAASDVPLPVARPNIEVATASSSADRLGGISAYLSQVFALSQSAPLREDKRH